MINTAPLATKNFMSKSDKQSNMRRFINRICDARAWSDWDRIKASGEFVSNDAKSYFKINAAKRHESFEAARSRMKLSDEDLASRATALFRLSLIMLSIALGLFAYAIYHFIYGTIHAGIFSCALMMLALAMSFRYNFWSYQIKTQKLGCSFTEWYHYGLRKNRHE